MKRLTLMIALLCVTIAAPAAPLLAQTPVPAAGGTAQSQQPQGPVTTLKLTVVIARFSGEKKIGNLPFVLLLMPTDDRTSVQMSSSVPVPTSAFGPPGAVQSFQYQNVGTNISASTGKEQGSGQYVVNLTISDSQILTDAASPTEATKGMMRTQNFTSSVRLPLKDGQTITYNAATDKLTGDLVRVEVTLNVLK